MVKTNTPFFSLGAQGSIADTLTAQKRAGETLIRKKPKPFDQQSLPQIYQRWLYQNGIFYWNTLSDATKSTWRRDGSRKHMTGFAYFMSDYLKTLPDMVGAWHFDNITGGLTADFSKQGNAGTVFGAFLVPGTIDQALSFDGVDNRVVCGTDPSLNLTTDQMTLAMIVTPEIIVGGAANRRLAVKGDLDYTMEITNSLSRIRFGINIGNTVYWSGSFNPSPGVTYRLVGIYTGAKVTLFVNGTEYSGAAISGNMRDSLALDFVIGALFGGGRPSKGVIDEVELFNRAWALEQVLNFQERRYPL